MNSHSAVNFTQDKQMKLIQEAVYHVRLIDKLGDELLLEILIRLPNSKSATLCKSVSKRWLHLISSNLFVAQFERNRRKTSLPFAFVSRYYNPIQKSMGTHAYSNKYNEADFACFGLASNLISPLFNEHRLVAVYMDLLLFSSTERILGALDVDDVPLRRTYVICNPRTKQWFSLPPLPLPLGYFASAIVCEPYCSSENYKGKRCIQDSYRYRVFSLPLGSGPPKLYVYKSETHQWETLFLSCTHCRICPNVWSPPTMYNGKLHLLNQSNIVAFDPFGAEDEGGVVLCYVIDLPSGSNWHACCTHLGTSSGSLLFCMRHSNESIFKVWDLKDYEKGEWQLKHEFSMIDLIVIEVNVIDITAVRNMRVLGFHPYDIDIIYVSYNHCILECNMKARTSLVVHECQDIRFYQVFLPWWPTPVPAVTQDKSL